MRFFLAQVTASARVQAVVCGAGDRADQERGHDQRDDERVDEVAGAEEHGGDDAAEQGACHPEDHCAEHADPLAARYEQVREAADREPDDEPRDDGINSHESRLPPRNRLIPPFAADLGYAQSYPSAWGSRGTASTEP